MVYDGISHESLYFLGIHTGLNARVYTEEIQVTRGIFHGIPRESVANYFVPCHRKYSGRTMGRLGVIPSSIQRLVDSSRIYEDNLLRNSVRFAETVLGFPKMFDTVRFAEL